jgi:hypothetical protein
MPPDEVGAVAGEVQRKPGGHVSTLKPTTPVVTEDRQIRALWPIALDPQSWRSQNGVVLTETLRERCRPPNVSEQFS